jgi:WD40 repeat protein
MKVVRRPVSVVRLFFAMLAIGLSAESSGHADELKTRATLGKPRSGAPFGYADTDSHLALAFSPDAKTLVAASLDGQVRLWDVRTGEEKVSLNEESRHVWSAVYSPDGRSVALSGWETNGDKRTGKLRLWDLALGEAPEVFESERYGIYSAAFSPDGKTLAFGGDDRTVRLLNVASRAPAAVLQKSPAQWVLGVAFSPDGKTLAAGGGSSEPGAKAGTFFSIVRLWDVISGKEVAAFQGHTHWVSSVAFSPDGKTLASGSYDGTVRLWDVASRTQKAIFHGEHKQSMVLSIAFSHDGKILAIGGAQPSGAASDKSVGAVRLWGRDQGQRPRGN